MEVNGDVADAGKKEQGRIVLLRVSQLSRDYCSPGNSILARKVFIAREEYSLLESIIGSEAAATNLPRSCCAQVLDSWDSVDFSSYISGFITLDSRVSFGSKSLGLIYQPP